MPESIVTRELEGQRLALARHDKNSLLFYWTADTSRALRYASTADALAIAALAQREYGIPALVVDAAGNIAEPAAVTGIDLAPFYDAKALRFAGTRFLAHMRKLMGRTLTPIEMRDLGRIAAAYVTERKRDTLKGRRSAAPSIRAGHCANHAQYDSDCAMCSAALNVRA